MQISKSKSRLANTRIDPEEGILCFATKTFYGADGVMIISEVAVWSEETSQLKRIAIAGDDIAFTNSHILSLQFKLLEEVIVVMDSSVSESDALTKKQLAMCPPGGYRQSIERRYDDDGWWSWISSTYSSSLALSNKPKIKVMEIVPQ